MLRYLSAGKIILPSFSPFKDSLDVLTICLMFFLWSSLFWTGHQALCACRLTNISLWGRKQFCLLRKKIPGTTELGSKDSSSGIWSSGTPARCSCQYRYAIQTYMALRLEQEGSSVVFSLAIWNVGFPQREQHITLTTYSRNKKEFAFQRVANSSLAEGSQCIYDNLLGLKEQQDVHSEENRLTNTAYTLGSWRRGSSNDLGVLDTLLWFRIYQNRGMVSAAGRGKLQPLLGAV